MRLVTRKRHHGALVLAALAGLLSVSASAPPRKAWLGIHVGPPAAVEDPSTGRPHGITVHSVISNGPADKAGLRARDVILAVDGMPLFSQRELIEAIGTADTGRWVTLTILRGGDERDLRDLMVQLGDPPPPGRKSFSVRRAWIGVELLDIPPAVREHFGAPDDAGVMVSGVTEGSPAEIAGISVGDVIHLVDETRVATARELAQRIALGGVGNEIEITLARGGAELTLDVVLESRPSPRERRPKPAGRR